MNVRLGISPCPNDTFAFHGLLSGAVQVAGLHLEIELDDIQALNERLRAGALDAAKVSFHAALQEAPRYCVLPVGAAVGFGVGPLLVGRAPRSELPAPAEVLTPGADTTASLLLRAFHPELRQAALRFDRILPALARGEAQLGAVIHEGRFTYAAHGLHLHEDLGDTWERRTGLPLPLGGLVARRDLPPAVLEKLVRAVRHSLSLALADRSAPLPTMRRHAQEMADDVMLRHVELYVNPLTMDLGEPGRAALDALADLALEVLPSRYRRLEILR